MGYDYAKYRNQIDHKRNPLLPVITIVLNFSDKPIALLSPNLPAGKCFKPTNILPSKLVPVVKMTVGE